MLDINKYLNEVANEAFDDKIEEIEYDFYAKITDFDQLKKAKYKKDQEQWSLFFFKEAVRCSLRVRKITDDKNIKFEIANKLKIGDLDDEWEIEKEIERHHFDILKSLSKSGMMKTRYYFPINETDMVWEVDVFYNSKGEPLPWVKVDLEVDQRLNKLPPYPIEAEEWIEEQFNERSPETIDKIDKLYKNLFIIRKKK